MEGIANDEVVTNPIYTENHFYNPIDEESSMRESVINMYEKHNIPIPKKPKKEVIKKT